MKINNKTIGYISIVVLLSLMSFISVNLFFQQRTGHDVIDINSFPYAIGDWIGKALPIEDYEYKILETKNLILREYENSKNDKIVLFIVYSETNRSVFHPPEVCLIGSGVEIVDKKAEKINYAKNIISANKLDLAKGDNKELALYCYKAGNLHTDKYWLQQVYFALGQLFNRRIKGATIRVSMPIKIDEETTLSTLKDFMRQSVKIVDDL